MRMTTAPAPGFVDVIALITSPARTGVATATPDDAITRPRKIRIDRRYGLANLSTRSAVSRPTFRLPSSSRRRAERMAPQLDAPICDTGHLRLDDRPWL